MKCHALLFLYFLISHSISVGQKMDWRVYGPKQGYPSLSPKAMVQDSNDILWIGTSSGLFSFDSHNFEHYTMQDGMPSNYVNALNINPKDQKIWLSTVSSIATFDGKIFSKIEIVDAKSNQRFISISINAKGMIFVGTSNGFVKIENEKQKRYTENDQLSNNSVKCFLQLVDNETYIGTAQGLNMLSSTNELTQVKYTEGYNVRKLIMNALGEIYMIEGLGNVRKKVDDAWTLISEDYFVSNIFFDQNDALNVVNFKEIKIFSNDTIQRSINSFDWAHLDETVGFSYLDRDNHYWVYKGNQLAHSKIPTIELIKPCPADQNFCQIQFASIHQTEDYKIWVSTEYGTGQLLDDKIQEPIFNFPGSYAITQGMNLDDYGNYWSVFTLGGITKWDGRDTTNFFNQGPLSTIQFFSLIKLQDGSLIAGRRDGYVRIKNEKLILIKPKKLKGKDVSTIAEDSHQAIWIGSNYSGLFKLRADTVVETYLDNIPILSVKYHKEKLWILTNGMGLIETSLTKDGSIENFHYHNKQNGFPFKILLDFKFDTKDDIWLTSYNSLIRFDTESNTYITFTEEDNFIPYSFNSNSIIIDTNNILLMACDSGVLKLDLNNFEIDNKPVKLHIETIKIADKATNRSKFKAKENYISFEYKGVYLNNPKRVLFRTKLLGLNEVWSAWTQENKITFSSLPSGKFVFQVQANNGNGILTNKIEYPFEIATPLIENRIFQVFLGLMILAFGMVFFRQKVINLKRKASRQNEIDKKLARLEIDALRSKMNPHFIFNSLNSIQHLIIENNEKGALDYLNKFGKLIRQILEKSADSKIKLLEEIELLRNYIDLESLRFDHPFEYFISVSPELGEENPEIPYLLIQPFVENAIHHGLIPKIDTGLLKIIATKENEFIKIMIEDNGVGRNAAVENGKNIFGKKKSKGIEVTQNRLRLLHDNLKSEFVKIIDLFDEQTNQSLGTKVEIIIPI